MKTIVLALALGAAMRANESEPAREITVFVQVQARAPQGTVRRAKMVASAMFAAIGLRIDWRGDRPDCARQPEACSGPNGRPIRIILRSETAQGAAGEELAFAQPGSGLIHVWYGQIEPMSRTWPGLVPQLLAHVLVHEITHVLQRVPRHSNAGVMQPHWDLDDYRQMTRKPLPFTDEDVRLIRRGLVQLGSSAPAR